MKSSAGDNQEVEVKFLVADLNAVPVSYTHLN